MINTYDFQVEHPEMFSQLAIKDLLFLYYKCPQEEKKINLYTHFNKIIFVLEGKKMIHHREKSWLLGAYINFMMDEGDERIKATYRDNYKKLAEIKPKYDPNNLFRVNQNIKPQMAAAMA